MASKFRLGPIKSSGNQRGVEAGMKVFKSVCSKAVPGKHPSTSIDSHKHLLIDCNQFASRSCLGPSPARALLPGATERRMGTSGKTCG